MTPTRELALQIHREAKKFCKPLSLRVTCVYGGTGISEQVKTRGAPDFKSGRNSGRISWILLIMDFMDSLFHAFGRILL